MKQPSEQARYLINQLQNCVTEEKDLFGRVKRIDVQQPVELINQIVALKEWPAVVGLLPCVVSLHREIAKAAAAGIDVLLHDMNLPLLLYLSDRLRGGYYTVPINLVRWNCAQFADLERALSRNISATVAGLASFHSNGFVREAATRYLSTIHDGSELPYLLIRLSDWVKQVRVVAERAVEKRIGSNMLEPFVDNLALLERIRQKERNEPGSKRLELIDRVHATLQKTQNKKLLLDGLLNKNYMVRRICLRLLKESKSSNLAEIIDRIIKDKNIINRRAAIDLSQDLPPSDRLALLRKCIKDKAPSVRRMALEALCDISDISGRGYLEPALLDKSPIVREFARWRLKNCGIEIDFRQIYISETEQNRNINTLPNAIAGLAEVGTIADAQMVLPFIDHEALCVRTAAVRALVRLNAEAYIEQFLRMLNDKNPGLSNAAQAGLERTINVVEIDSLFALLTATSFWHVKRNVLHLLNEATKWERIGYLLLAVSLDDVRVKNEAMKRIENWLSKYRTTWSHTKPNAKQRERFNEGMRKANNLLPARLLEPLLVCGQSMDN